MLSNWAQTQREGWLCRLYGSDSSDGTRKLLPESVQFQLVDILEGLLSHHFPPADAAAKTASLIMSQTDVDTPWANLVGLCLNAAEEFDDERDLQALVDYIVELADLPDAVNESPEAKTLKVGGRALHTEPGHAVIIEEGRLWRKLPIFSWSLTDRFQGPERYLANRQSPASADTAKSAWRNLNTYVALMAVHPGAQRIPVLASQARRGLVALAMALEHSPDTRWGKNVELHAPAAVQWLRIAGDEMDRLCRDGTERMTAGDLWKGVGGSEV